MSRVRGGRHRGERLQRACGLDRVAHRVRRHTVAFGLGDIDLTALVEHPDDRQLLHPQAPLLPNEVFPPRGQSSGRPAPQIVEALHNVEHLMIQSWGCDGHRPYQPYFADPAGVGCVP